VFIFFVNFPHRLRDPVKYDEIWSMVNRTLNQTDYDVQWAAVFPGKWEARFSWIAANILNGARVS